MHSFLRSDRIRRVCCLVLGGCCLGPGDVMGFAAGTGDASNPYQVQTAEHLDAVRDHLGAHFLQIADINMDVEPHNSGAGWIPIGTTSNPFTGVYDGNGHTVSNLFINRTSDYQGLFGFLDDGRIEGLTVSNFDVTARDRSAGLAGQIENNSVVSNCVAIGTFTARSRAGALVGSVQDHSRIEDSYAIATVIATSERVGVLTGQLWNNSAAVRSFSLGSVIGTIRTGGLVGNQNNSTVEDSYSGAAVTGTSNVGGLVGAVSGGAVVRSYSYGEVEGSGSSIGGLIGDVSVSPDVSDSYWDVETSLQATSGGEPDAAGKPTSFMVQPITYVDWDFDTLWAIGHAGDYTYPYFQGQAPATLPMADVLVPFAADLAIDGIALLGETLMGSYTYFSSSDGHTEDVAWFQWLRADGPAGPYEEITDATNILFEVDSGGEHRWYQFEVIVRDATGVTSHTHSVTLDFMDGAGTPADPFRIEHAYQLNGVRDHLGSTFLQVADLNLESYVNWLPIGTQAEPFAGAYHGGSNVIISLTIDRPDEDHVGLFGYMDGSSWVRHLTLTDVAVTGSNAVGAIAGFKESTAEVTNCHMTGVVTGTGDYVGGLFGRLNGTLSDSSVDATVTGGNYVGGLVGGNMPYHSSFTVHRSVMRGEVTGSNWVAGIGAVRGRGEDNINYATIQGHDRVGGLFGRVIDAAVVRGVNYGAVTGTGDMVGGIVGNHHYTGAGSNAGISYSYNLGAVTGVGSVGGIVGRAEGQSVFRSYNRGSVTGTSSVGGIAGHGRRTIYGGGGIHFCYNAGIVDGTSDTGALIGSRSSSSSTQPSVARSYYDHQTSGVGDPLGFARSTAEMIQQVTFEEWSFDTDWSIGHTGEYTYPYLQWQGTNDIPYVNLPIPFASDVFVTGTDSEGETLTGHYTYHPNSAGDPEGATTFRWLRAATKAGPFEAIAGATNQTYMLVEGDDNHWYQFEVTVRDVEDNVGAPVTAMLEFTSGAGTANDPLLIGNAIQLDRIRNYLGSTYSDLHFALIADINLGVPPWNEGAGWVPLGSSSSDSFQGNLNGRGHVIRNLTINRPGSSQQGLFGYLWSGGQVALLGLEDVHVVGDRYVGGLAGWISSSFVRHCYVTGHVEGDQQVGGLAGSSGSSASVFYCYSTASVTGGVTHVGGLLGNGGAFGSYWDTETSGQTTSGNGDGQEGKTTAEMQQRDTYTHWNFQTLWAIDEDASYPHFQAIQAYDFPQHIEPEHLMGSGTAADPWLIHDLHELNAIRLAPTNHYRLANDIDLTEAVVWDQGCGWPPIGTSSSATRFSGVLDGDGYVIRNLTISRHNDDYQGLFGYVDEGIIRNLGVEDQWVWGGRYVGGLAGQMSDVTLDDVHASGTIVGQLRSVGGIGGRMWGGVVHNAHSACEVIGYDDYTGGLLGEASSSAPRIRRSWSTGSVVGSNTVGGLVGRLSTGAVLTDSYSHSPVSGHNNVGGLVGDQSADILRAYSMGSVTGTGVNIGGLIGTYSSGATEGLYWDIDASGLTNSATGIGYSTPVMWEQATYETYNFNTVWRIEEGADYPVHRDTSAQPLPAVVDLNDLAGNGTSEMPYLLTNADELNAIRQDLAAHYQLANDIDLYASANWHLGLGWLSIGTSGDRFTGSFDGAGHTISNLTINRPGTNEQGLFGYADNADIHNVVLEQVFIDGGNDTGGLIGQADSTQVRNVHVRGWIRGGSNTGGLMGTANSSHGDQLSSEVFVQGGNRTGGVIGRLSGGSLQRVRSDAVVDGGNNSGGVAGHFSSVSIRHSASRGSVSGTGTVGGFVGHHHSGHIADCYSRSTVSNSGNVTGGFVGRTGSGTTQHGNIYRSFSTGAVSSDGSDIGGFQGAWSRGTVNECYWDTEASGQAESIRGIGLNTEEMQQAATYLLHNFVTLWEIDEGNDYPVFQDLWDYAHSAEVDVTDLNGEGTEADPYLITSADELNAMRQDLTAHYRLAADIDLSASVIWNAGLGWEPVGPTSILTFSGSLDGAGYVISNLVVNRPTSGNQGLFGYASGARLSNLMLNEVNVYGDANVGGLAGELSGSGLADRITITGTIGSQGQRVGGLVGRLSGASVHYASMNGVVDAKGSNAGGLIGYAASASIRNSASRGTVSGDGAVGGFVGHHHSGHIADCYSRSTVSNSGNVTGGFVGRTGSGTTQHGNIYRSFSTGAVSSDGSDIGGFQGAWSRGTVNECYWDTEASGQAESIRGIGLNTEEMQQAATYLLHNFVTLWEIDEGNDYPVFQDSSDHAQPVEVALADLDGEGTEADPYLITSADELNAMRQDLTAHYRLAADIDLSASVIWNAGHGWEPVGPTSLLTFSGSLDGAGHTISNLVVNRPTDSHQGLFGYASAEKVTDLSLKSVNVYGDASVGALAGDISGAGHVERIRVKGTVAGQGTRVGGVAGRLSGGVMDRVSMSGRVDSFGNDVGGLIGQALGGANIQFSSSWGHVHAVNNVGGLVGYHQNATLMDSFSRMGVSGGSSVGGAIGRNGGGVGNNGVLNRVYSAGSVEGTGSSVGGLVGWHSRGTVSDSYWDTEVSGQPESGSGDGRSTEAMTYPHDAGTTYWGWDFVEVWSEDVAALNAGYPRLLNPDERNLLYLAGAGGMISGPTIQVVLAGQDGAPVEAVPDDGAEFDQWSDGRTDNPRSDTNVTANLSVTAHFKSISMVPIDWYDEHGITRGEGETWGDVDQRHDPDKRMTLLEQYIADLDPADSNSVFHVFAIEPGPPVEVHFEPGSTGRVYSLQFTDDLIDGMWTDVPGTPKRFGEGGQDTLIDTNGQTVEFLYRISVELP